MFGYYLPERWKRAPDPFMAYEVSSYGRVRKAATQRLVTQFLVKGVKVVSMTHGLYETGQKRVAWLVYNTFCGKARTIMHYDECKTHNHWMNLISKEDYVRREPDISTDIARDIIKTFLETQDSTLTKEAIQRKWRIQLTRTDVSRIIRGLTHSQETGVKPRSMATAKREANRDNYSDLF